MAEAHKDSDSTFEGAGFGSSLTDWDLVERTSSGDDRAFDALMERYKRPVLSFLFRMVGSAAEAEDLAQEAFVRAYHGMCRPRFRRTTAEFSTWLFQIARNAALDRLRWRKRHPTEPLAEAGERGAVLVGPGKTPSEDAVAKETGELIAAAVALLPEDQRTAVVLAEYEGLSYSDIAAVMGCSEKSVEARLYRARRLLRRRLRRLLEE